MFLFLVRFHVFCIIKSIAYAQGKAWAHDIFCTGLGCSFKVIGNSLLSADREAK